MPCSYFATDCGEKIGRISRRAQWCSGGSDVIGGAATSLYGICVPSLIGGTTRICCDVNVSTSWAKATTSSYLVGIHEPPHRVRVGNRALPAREVVPHRVRIADEFVVEDVVVRRPVEHRFDRHRQSSLRDDDGALGAVALGATRRGFEVGRIGPSISTTALP